MAGPRGSKAYLTFALNLSPKIVTFFSGKFGQPYSKMTNVLTHIAVADDGGAMENLGLITYENRYLLALPTANLDDLKIIGKTMRSIHPT